MNALRLRVLSIEANDDPLVRDASVDQTETSIGDVAWRVVLRLGRPKGGEWDTANLRELRSKIRELAAEVAEEKDVDLYAPILIETTAYDASESETAPPDEPEPDEDPTAVSAAEDEGARQ